MAYCHLISNCNCKREKAIPQEKLEGYAPKTILTQKGARKNPKKHKSADGAFGKKSQVLFLVLKNERLQNVMALKCMMQRSLKMRKRTKNEGEVKK
jgi:hypothetical protein